MRTVSVGNWIATDQTLAEKYKNLQNGRKLTKISLNNSKEHTTLIAQMKQIAHFETKMTTFDLLPKLYQLLTTSYRKPNYENEVFHKTGFEIMNLRDF